MSARIQLNFLLRPDTDTIDDLSSQFSKRIVLKGILTDDETWSSAFSAVGNTDKESVSTFNSVVETGKGVGKTKKTMRNQIAKHNKCFSQICGIH